MERKVWINVTDSNGTLLDRVEIVLKPDTTSLSIREYSTGHDDVHAVATLEIGKA